MSITQQTDKDVLILAIESSCDETASAVIRNGREIRSDFVFSQIPLHTIYGGVVPEIASRAHVEKIDTVVSKALEEAGCTLKDIQAIAVTHGPGLVGALLVGVSYAKALAYALHKPLIGVNHIEGHICANYLCHPTLYPPFLCLVASGGHSHLMLVNQDNEYKLVGMTRDDAAGEAFDKAARVLNLPYPGGPKLDALAEKGDDSFLKLPTPHAEGPFDFSFSGLKTAFLNAEHKMRQNNQSYLPEDMAASFRKAVVDSLVQKTMAAADHYQMETIVLAGGVSANTLLRRQMADACQKKSRQLYMPSLHLCGDNAAMIGAAGYIRYMKGETAPLELNAEPSLRLV